MVNATHKTEPNAYTLHSGRTFTIVQCPLCANAALQVPTLSASAPCVALFPGPYASLLLTERGRQRRQSRKKELRTLRKAQDLVLGRAAAPAHCWFPSRH